VARQFIRDDPRLFCLCIDVGFEHEIVLLRRDILGITGGCAKLLVCYFEFCVLLKITLKHTCGQNLQFKILFGMMVRLEEEAFLIRSICRAEEVG